MQVKKGASVRIECSASGELAQQKENSFLNVRQNVFLFLFPISLSRPLFVALFSFHYISFYLFSASIQVILARTSRGQRNSKICRAVSIHLPPPADRSASIRLACCCGRTPARGHSPNGRSGDRRERESDGGEEVLSFHFLADNVVGRIVTT